jgi:hypothetical protein
MMPTPAPCSARSAPARGAPLPGIVLGAAPARAAGGVTQWVRNSRLTAHGGRDHRIERTRHPQRPLLPSPGCRSDSAEGFAKQAFDASLAEFGVGAQLGEHGLHLGLAKAEVAQSGEDLGVCVDALRHERVAVGSAGSYPAAPDGTRRRSSATL